MPVTEERKATFGRDYSELQQEPAATAQLAMATQSPRPSMGAWRDPDDDPEWERDIDEDPSPEDIARFGTDDRDDGDDNNGRGRRRRGSGDDDPNEARCQECRQPMFADADICPRCGAFQMRLDGDTRRRRFWTRPRGDVESPIPPLRDRFRMLVVALVVAGLLLMTAPVLWRIFL